MSSNLINLLALLALLSSLYALYSSLMNKKYEKQILEFEKGKSVGNQNLNNSIRLLTSYAMNLTPEYIIGINRGGVMIGAMVAFALRVPSSHFLRIYVESHEDLEARYKERFSSLEGRILLVDDASRSGDTFRQAYDFLHSKIHFSSELFTATLFTYVNEKHKPAFSKLDFASYQVRNKKFRLPWSTPNADPTTKQQEFLLINKHKNVNEIVEIAYEQFDLDNAA